MSEIGGRKFAELWQREFVASNADLDVLEGRGIVEVIEGVVASVDEGDDGVDRVWIFFFDIDLRVARLLDVIGQLSPRK